MTEVSGADEEFLAHVILYRHLIFHDLILHLKLQELVLNNWNYQDSQWNDRDTRQQIEKYKANINLLNYNYIFKYKYDVISFLYIKSL